MKHLRNWVSLITGAVCMLLVFRDWRTGVPIYALALFVMYRLDKRRRIKKEATEVRK